MGRALHSPKQRDQIIQYLPPDRLSALSRLAAYRSCRVNHISYYNPCFSHLLYLIHSYHRRYTQTHNMKPEDLSFLDQLEEWLEAQVPRDLGGLPHRMLETMERMSNEICMCPVQRRSSIPPVAYNQSRLSISTDHLPSLSRSLRSA